MFLTQVSSPESPHRLIGLQFPHREPFVDQQTAPDICLIGELGSSRLAHRDLSSFSYYSFHRSPIFSPDDCLY